MIKTKYPIVVIVVFVWIGFICAISFMEAWLKFQAPGITVALGLGIGKLVFNALNKIECLFAVIIIANAVFIKEHTIPPIYLLFIIPGILLVIQSVWLLPILDERAQLIIEGKYLPSSNFHFYYIATEIVKVVCLSIFGINLFK